MRKPWRSAFFAALALSLSLQTSAEPKALPPLEFAQPPALGFVRINPAGTRLAWIRLTVAGPDVVIHDLATSSTSILDPEKLEWLPPNDLVWADDNNLFVYSRDASVSMVSSRKFTASLDGSSRVFKVPASGKSARQLLARAGAGADVRVLLPAREDGKVVMESLNRGPGTGSVMSVLSVDSNKGSASLLESGTPKTLHWIVDGNGHAVARLERMEPAGFSIQARKDGLWRDIYTNPQAPLPRYLGLAEDESQLVAIAALDGPEPKLWFLPLDASPGRTLPETAGAAIDDILLDPYTQKPAGVRHGGAHQASQWFAPRMQALEARLEKTFPGKLLTITGRSGDGSRIAVAVYGPSQPATFYLVDFERRTADTIAEAYPQLGQAVFGELNPFEYKARDGAPMVAYLTTPPGKDRDKLPVVVLPHDGPGARDDFRFDPTAQFFASRGYAVLQPQFRGSTGFGEAHREAGEGQWGRRMQQDVIDALTSLIASGRADPARICIVGTGYGGYVALAGAAFSPELFACAASIGGISDLPRLLEGKVRGSREASNSWPAYLGTTDARELAEISPARAAGQVRARVLLLHDQTDPVVPIEQSELMAEELRKNGKQVEFVRFTAEDRISFIHQRARILGELESFLAASLDIPRNN